MDRKKHGMFDSMMISKESQHHFNDVIITINLPNINLNHNSS